MRQIEQLIRAARMTSRSVRLEAPGHDGGVLSMERSLPLQSVELIELRTLNH
jgi:hypothetical protein